MKPNAQRPSTNSQVTAQSAKAQVTDAYQDAIRVLRAELSKAEERAATLRGALEIVLQGKPA